MLLPISLMIQFAGVGSGTVGGVGTYGQRFGLAPTNSTNRTYYWGNGGPNVAGAQATANMCISAGQCYLNGVADATASGSFTGSNPCHILRANGLTGITTGYVRAVGYKTGSLTGAQVAAAYAAMAAL